MKKKEIVRNVNKWQHWTNRIDFVPNFNCDGTLCDDLSLPWWPKLNESFSNIVIDLQNVIHDGKPIISMYWPQQCNNFTLFFCEKKIEEENQKNENETQFVGIDTNSAHWIKFICLLLLLLQLFHFPLAFKLRARQYMMW